MSTTSLLSNRRSLFNALNFTLLYLSISILLHVQPATCDNIADSNNPNHSDNLPAHPTDRERLEKGALPRGSTGYGYGYDAAGFGSRLSIAVKRLQRSLLPSSGDTKSLSFPRRMLIGARKTSPAITNPAEFQPLSSIYDTPHETYQYAASSEAGAVGMGSVPGYVPVVAVDAEPIVPGTVEFEEDAAFEEDLWAIVMWFGGGGALFALWYKWMGAPPGMSVVRQALERVAMKKTTLADLRSFTRIVVREEMGGAVRRWEVQVDCVCV